MRYCPKFPRISPRPIIGGIWAESASATFHFWRKFIKPCSPREESISHTIRPVFPRNVGLAFLNLMISYPYRLYKHRDASLEMLPKTKDSRPQIRRIF
jgi:hypothetical protein